MFYQSFLTDVPIKVSWNHIIFDTFILLIFFDIHSKILLLILTNACKERCSLLTNDRSISFLFVFGLCLSFDMKILSLFTSVFLDLFDDFLFIKTKIIINSFISLISVFNCNKTPKFTLLVILFS